MSESRINNNGSSCGGRVRWGAILGALLVAAGIVAGVGVERMRAEPAAVKELPARSENSWRITGVGSCTAAGCHGGGHPETIGSEYNIWISEDPHAKAYSTLFDERSKQIVRLLAGAQQNPITPAHQDARCLACHSMTDAKARDEMVDVVSDGVGCEACHGPAEGWLAVHSEHPLDKQEREQLGLWDTDSLLARTQLCVRCHVGSPDRDVDHDLIAAGHPRLQFSMSAYWEALPKHWDDAKDRAPWGANYDALIWALGQACTSEAALGQLADRAKSGKNWPEFAEWSCFACHHDLRNDAAIQESLARQGNLSGRHIPWDTWNHFGTREFAIDVSAAFGIETNSAQAIEQRLREVGTNMREIYPNRSAVAQQAGSAAELVAAWAGALERGGMDRLRLDRLMRAIIDRSIRANAQDWSAAAQTYDALASLQQSRLQYVAGDGQAIPQADREFSQALRRLYEALAASEGGQRFDPDKFRQQLVQLGELLPAERSAP